MADEAILKLLVLRAVLDECSDDDKPPKVTSYVGLRVVRGPDWKWVDQDDGEGLVGTVVEISSTHEKTVGVQWDCGYHDWYRVGADGAFDLRIVDSAPAGVKHPGVICNSCRGNSVFGIRWKCEICPDFDLCTPCYMADKHDVSHRFYRIGVADAPRVRVPERANAAKVPMRGIFASAVVVRGPDWDWGNQDGDNGKIGYVENVHKWEDDTDRNAVKVYWAGKDSSLLVNTYRLGYNGKVDLKYVLPARDGTYYRDHLPVLGDEMREVREEESNEMLATTADIRRGLLFLSENMKNSFLSDKFSDLTIRVKERVFPVHKFILCARSAVFESMLPSDSEKVLDLSDCDPLVFEDLLYYVYTGTLKLTAQAHIDDLHALAQRFNILGLKIECNRVKKALAKEAICILAA